MRALLLEDPTSAYRILVPLIGVLMIGAIFVGISIDDKATEIISGIVLLITSMICYRILNVRRKPNAPMLSGPSRIWALIAAGFMYLALDETFSIHEKIDKMIHSVLAMEETGLSDRIDDFIIPLYGIIGAILIYFHRTEFRSLTVFYKYLVAGFMFLCVMVFLDAFSNRADVIEYLGFEGVARKNIKMTAKYGEETMKLLSEAAFLFGFLGIYRKFYDERKASALGQA
mgnify:FL=1